MAQKRGRGVEGDADVALMREQYQYSLKQYAVRALERYDKALLPPFVRGAPPPVLPSPKTEAERVKLSADKTAALPAFDRLYLTWLSFYERRDERHVSLLMNSSVRVPWKHIDKLLCDVEDNEYDEVVKCIDDLLNSLQGAKEAVAVEELDQREQEDVEEDIFTTSSFWGLAKQYLAALKLSRSMPYTAFEDSIENQVLEFVEANRHHISEVVTQLQAVVFAAEAADAAAGGSSGGNPTLKGGEILFFRAAAAMANVIRWSKALDQYYASYFLGEDSLPPPPMEASREALEQQQDVNHIMTEDESLTLMHNDGALLEEGEEIFTGEVVLGQQALAGSSGRAGGGPGQVPSSLGGIAALKASREQQKARYERSLRGDMDEAPEDGGASEGKKKPQRFAKVQTGYSWNKYNKAHFDSKAPPPKVVNGYEFVLFYPEAVNATKPPTYRLVPTEKGWDDDHCYIIFSCPYDGIYEDVVYKIMNKPWEKRRGAVRASFDSYGKFKLNFRFEHRSYRR